jgi:hypothetical protein
MYSCFGAFSLRDPLSASLENAIAAGWQSVPAVVKCAARKAR